MREIKDKTLHEGEIALLQPKAHVSMLAYVPVHILGYLICVDIEERWRFIRAIQL